MPPLNISVLSYNVWFNEECHLRERMLGIACIIEEAGYPDVLMFQARSGRIST
jgi:hypothetical protein